MLVSAFQRVIFRQSATAQTISVSMLTRSTGKQAVQCPESDSEMSPQSLLVNPRQDTVTDAQTVFVERDDSPLTELGNEPPPPPKKRSRHEPTSVPLSDSDLPRKKTRARKTKEPIVYDISPVVTKDTTFKGRLGYVSLRDPKHVVAAEHNGQACLNTILRVSKPPVFCSRYVSSLYILL
jgi:hypothetical protein